MTVDTKRKVVKVNAGQIMDEYLRKNHPELFKGGAIEYTFRTSRSYDDGKKTLYLIAEFT